MGHAGRACSNASRAVGDLVFRSSSSAVVHAGDISVMVLAWHFGALALMAVLGGQFGRLVLNWRALAARSGVVAVH